MVLVHKERPMVVLGSVRSEVRVHKRRMKVVLEMGVNLESKMQVKNKNLKVDVGK